MAVTETSAAYDAPAFAARAVKIAHRLRRAAPPSPPIALYWALFAGSASSFVVSAAIGDGPSALTTLIAAFGAAACGWSWLFARALFRPREDMGVWPIVMVAALAAAAAVITFVDAFAPGLEASSPALRIIDNGQKLLGSAALLLAISEALQGYSSALPRSEKRLRAFFITSYAAMVAIAVLWANQSAEGTLAAQWSDAVKIVCASAALIGATAAMRYRTGHPLKRAAPSGRVSRRAATADDHALSTKIMQALTRDDLFATPDLSVAQLARRLNAPEYKVTQAITGALGARNFNQLINTLRIERAKQLLADPALADQSIFAIALDCGFASIGPFNRAFKQMTSSTPSAFRAEQARGRKSPNNACSVGE